MTSRLLVVASALVLTASCVPRQQNSEAKTDTIYTAEDFEKRNKLLEKKAKLEKELLNRAIKKDERVKNGYLKITSEVIMKDVDLRSQGVERTCMMEEKFDEKGPTVYTYRFYQIGNVYRVSLPSEKAKGLALFDGDKGVDKIHELIILFEEDPVDLKGGKIKDFKVLKVKVKSGAPAPC